MQSEKIEVCARGTGLPRTTYVSIGRINIVDQKIVGIVGAVAGLAALDATQGAATAAPNPQGFSNAKSYAELLDPIPNALALLRESDVAAASAPQDQKENGVELAYYHHHHHHHWWRRYHHHHHHHWWRRYYHHHHHHYY
jgi:hypothetical protein